MSHGDPEKFRAANPVRSNRGTFARVPDVRGRETQPKRTPAPIFGPRGDTSSFSNRGRQSLGTINKPQMPPAAVTRIQPSTPPSGFTRQPSAPMPRVNIPPSSPRPAESVQPQRTPSVTFGGYRGGSEANAQSQRGQSSRQSMETRPSAPPPSAPPGRSSAPEGRSPAGGRFGR